MYIKSVIIDGFKSYGRRTEIHGFDPEFTAITGLNGTGKSNILDAICFVLGISNLGQVRATSLQDLVYKGGQAGITKATVTLVFDNSDPDQCPLGYEKCREISVTRQIVVGGKNKYMINGKNVQNKKVTDLFCSVQLNVNNPNFLIMQGRITKVLNMKPQEILSMIEEAAGTSMYEAKRDASQKLLMKKECKFQQTDTMLKEDVEPRLEKLRQERSAYTEFQKVCRDIEYLTRIHISFKYLKQKEMLEKATKSMESLENYLENSKQTIKSNEEEIVKLEELGKKTQEKIDKECGGMLKELETELGKKTNHESIVNGNLKAAQTNLEQEKKKLKQLDKSIKDDENALIAKETEMQKVEGLFQSLKDADEHDAKAYTDAQKKFEAVTQGLSTNDEGEASSLQNQLIIAKQQITEAQTTIKTSEMELKHSRASLKQKQGQIQSNDAAYLKDKKTLDHTEKEIARLKAEMSKINYKEGLFEELEQQQINLQQDIRRLKQQLDNKNSYKYELQYRDPEPNFDRSKVHGMVGKLFSVPDKTNCFALSMCAGGSLFSYVTDDEVTSKKILQRGQLQKRVTIIPMNKINSNAIPSSVVQTAQNLVGKENVCSALSLINYDRYFDPVMNYVFGKTLICKDMNTAKQVTYNRNIMCRSVTLDGDVVDPEGTLSGGAKPTESNILVNLSEIKEIEDDINVKENNLRNINHQLSSIQNAAKHFNAIKEKLELRYHELNVCSERLAQTAFQQSKEEIEALKAKIEQLECDLVSAKEKLKTANAKVKDIQEKLTDSKGFRERELKSAQEAMKAAKKQSEQSRNNWKKREQDFETLRLEIEEFKKGIASLKVERSEIITNLTKLEEEIVQLKNEIKNITVEVNEYKNNIKDQKDKINVQSKEYKSYMIQKDKLIKQNQELTLEIKKKENENTKLKNDNKEMHARIENLEVTYGWIKEDREFFGIKNTRYDYSKENPVEAGKKVTTLLEQKTKMERNINLKAMMILEREEEAYQETLRKKKIVEGDNEKIRTIICKMDEKKKEKVEKAWRSVDSNFSSIFSSLLPGSQGKLRPVYQNKDLIGLEIKVGFNGIWKESLGELSGGQRSLVALSLVLAMLKFCPAPLYILDEVDAALDMSHTQNIGGMLKAHFTNSQFIIVSLKDGMFNNANVLFRTKFEEGVSAVVRTESKQHRKK